MRRRVEAFDWSATPLGDPGAWPGSLTTTVEIVLTSRYPMFIWWGAEGINIYNDAYAPFLGKRHPNALGGRAAAIWSDVWDVVGPQAAEVLAEGRSTWNEERLLVMERHGYTEETYFTFGYSPIPDSAGGTGGVLGVCTEETQKVLGRRRLRTLRELGLRTAAEARTIEDACASACAILAENSHDIPFALLYLTDAEPRARLAGTCGLSPGAAASPHSISLKREEADPASWPLEEAARTRQGVLVEDLVERVGILPGGPWPEAPAHALVLPILQSGQDRPTGFLVAGISPRRKLDDDYRGFLDLVAGHIATAVSSARAFEDERNRAERLAELDRAKTVFFSNVSHEFRTPLTLVLAPLEEALSSGSSAVTPEGEALVSVAHRNGLRLLKLVNTLLDFSRIEAGRIQASFVPTDLAAFTAELASVFRSAIEKAGMRLVVDCRPLGEPAYVDRDLWEKVVLNLLSNAFKYTFEGTITVSLQEEQGSVALSVMDTGTGIPPSELENIFKRFHRVQGARGRTFEGTGIGLSLVEELVKLHGGTIEVESAEGQGSTFRVRLPAGKGHLPPESIGREEDRVSTAIKARVFAEEAMRWLPDGLDREGAGRAGPARVGRIVVADDNADMREYLRGILEAKGYAVEAVEDGALALEAIRRERPSLLLTDVMMPVMDGFGLLAEVRSDPSLSHIPVVMLTARAGEESVDEGLSHGADDYILKPFAARELLARVHSNLSLAASRMKAEEERQELLLNERSAREEAERLGRLKDEFLATLSHELRTPLNAILGWTHLIRAHPLDTDMAGKGIEVIERSARTQAQLIGDLLDMSRIITGKLRLEIQAVELPLVVETAMDSIRPAADAKGVRVQALIEPLSVTFQGDPARLQQVVWNLLSNAIKFTPRGGKVLVKLTRVKSYVEIRVTDTGKGIKRDFLPHVFERFRQEDASSAREHMGLGIGLALVKHLVELHGGEVRAESGGEGKGSTFTVLIPLATTHREYPEEPTQSASGRPAVFSAELPDLTGVKVLVIDDEPDVRDLLKRILEQSSASTRVAASADEGLEILAREMPDVVISDIGMPGKDGYHFIEAVRRSGNAIPAAALTAFARSEDRTRALLSGYQSHVAKPVEPLELLVTVAALAGRTRAMSARGPEAALPEKTPRPEGELA